MTDLKSRLEPIDELGKGRDDFDRDYTAILYSHAFRRLRHKTQVIFYPQNDHVCTRLDHSLYVAAISEVVCKNLQSRGIDCDPMLARAIGIGHDVGHAPFGHAGQEVLNELAADIGGFAHEEHSLRIVDKIEKPRERGSVVGLNLTLAVRDGIVNHSGEDPCTNISPADSPNLKGKSYPCTLEGCIVRVVDKIAFLGRDLEDAVIVNLISEDEVPADISGKIGTKNGEIVDYFVGDMIVNSDENRIALSPGASQLMTAMAKFNDERIYKHRRIESYKERTRDILQTLFDRFFKAVNAFGNRIDRYLQHDSLQVLDYLGRFIGARSVLYFKEEANIYPDKKQLYERIVVDFLSTLTDRFVFEACEEYFLPKHIEIKA